ncbi:MAG: hypothetical protein ACI9N9_002352 [Enterobacterales bacterium]|jgi:hypothetical protein
MNLKKILLAFIISLSLTACMGVKFSYNNLDWFVPWFLDDYLELNVDQENAFDQHLEVIWNWHRLNELPQYSKLLNDIVNDLDKEQVTLEKIHYYSEQTRTFYYNIVKKALDEGKPLIKGLDKEQLNELYENIAESDEEYKEYIADNDLAKREEKQLKSIKKTFKKYIGKLSKKQNQLLITWTKDTMSTAELRIQYVAKVRNSFKVAMAGKENIAQTNKQLLILATQPELLQSKELNDKVERNNQLFRQLLIDTIGTLSTKQKRRLRKKILSYAEDFTELAGQTD